MHNTNEYHGHCGTEETQAHTQVHVCVKRTHTNFESCAVSCGARVRAGLPRAGDGAAAGCSDLDRTSWGRSLWDTSQITTYLSLYSSVLYFDTHMGQKE